jgi:DNA-binding PadR family transcriptional regulator
MYAHHHTIDPGLFGWLAMTRGPRGGGHRRGGRHGGPPFGFPGFGPARGPRARRGDVRTALLVLLAEGPRNGYQLMQEIEDRSGGVWRPSPGSVYPALQQLEDEGLISVEPGEGRKAYELTEEGRAQVAARGADAAAPWDAVKGDMGEGAWDLMGAMRQIGMALYQLTHSGTEAQQQEARALLDETRRGLYRILAEDDPTPPDVA